jgi:hypothetical protein
MFSVGYDSNTDIFYANNRVRSATLLFSDDTQLSVTLADRRGLQTVSVSSHFGTAKRTTSVKVIINSVFPGSRYDDTVLAEIEVWGYRVAEHSSANGRRNLAEEARVSASSTLSPDRWGGYYPYYAVDGSLATSWVEGLRGAGVGEWLRFVFPTSVSVDYLLISNGYDSSDYLFSANNRVKKATILFSDGSRIQIELADRRGLQKVPIAEHLDVPIWTTDIQFFIDAVYPGLRYDDTCLAELQIWGTD